MVASSLSCRLPQRSLELERQEQWHSSNGMPAGYHSSGSLRASSRPDGDVPLVVERGGSVATVPVLIERYDIELGGSDDAAHLA